jgi:hypothetical protein
LHADRTPGQGDGFFKRGEAFLNLLLDLCDGCLSEVNVRQDALEEEAMMRLHTSLSRQARVGQLGPEPSSCQVRKRLGILRASNQVCWLRRLSVPKK